MKNHWLLSLFISYLFYLFHFDAKEEAANETPRPAILPKKSVRVVNTPIVMSDSDKGAIYLTFPESYSLKDWYCFCLRRFRSL